jgi:hypothetical protein
MRRRRTDTAPPPLKPSVVALLLRGWGTEAPEPSAHGFGGGQLEVFERDGVARLWNDHEPFLRATAQRWGWEPDTVTAHGVRFHAEALALGELLED